MEVDCPICKNLRNARRKAVKMNPRISNVLSRPVVWEWYCDYWHYVYYSYHGNVPGMSEQAQNLAELGFVGIEEHIRDSGGREARQVYNRFMRDVKPYLGDNYGL